MPSQLLTRVTRLKKKDRLKEGSNMKMGALAAIAPVMMLGYLNLM